MPCVRVWDVAERTQVAEVQCHKYGVACVAFSTNGCYVVSVGFQHDRTVSVWEWKVSLVVTSYELSTLILQLVHLSPSPPKEVEYFCNRCNRLLNCQLF